jgi:hypothetical protein
MTSQDQPQGPTGAAATPMQRAGDWFHATRDHWKRGLLMLLYVLVFGLIKLAVSLIALFQFGYILITGGPNAPVRDFGASLALYTADLIDFLVCADERPPFPFREWPRPPRPDV